MVTQSYTQRLSNEHRCNIKAHENKNLTLNPSQGRELRWVKDEDFQARRVRNSCKLQDTHKEKSNKYGYQHQLPKQPKSPSNPLMVLTHISKNMKIYSTKFKETCI